MKYTCINIQGNLVSEEILQKVEAGTADGQTAEKFGLEKTANLKSEIEYAWSRIKLDWKYFSDRTDNLPATDPYGTSIARRWMKSFFDTLGFVLKDQKAALTGDNGKTYVISNTADNLDELPVHIVGFFDPNHPDRNTLDAKSSGGTSRMSPHATVQEYLNVTEHVYGMATNGLYLRLVRDSGRLVKLTYLEFDLKRMLDEDRYSEFTVLYRLIHHSRFPRNKQEADQCLLENYYKESIETGNRIRNGLSNAVKESMLALGKGFLQHEDNEMLRQQLLDGKITPKDFYRQLLRLIYRFLFLMVTEERDLVYDPDNKNPDALRKKRIYQQYYSIARLRRMSQQRYLYEARYNDLWQGLVQTFQLFDEMGSGRKMGIEPLAGDLFNSHALPTLEQSLISNSLLLECVRNMNEFVDEQKNLVPINYRSLDVEELGSVYEGLLELHPVIENLEAVNAAHINFTFHGGTDRKTTGSYYTRPDLVNELIKSALIPVIEDRLNEHAGNKDAQAKALLKLKICDAAAGSGHMLLAAARTIAWYLARVQTGEENPAPSVYRGCLREVIQHCVYAVDMNPDAVELCKLALWLEGHNSGKPLSFLDHKIRNGNSLVGVTDLGVLTKGIPDDAFNPVTGDDKELCKKLKKENKTKQYTLFDQGATSLPDANIFSDEYHELDDIKQDDVAAVARAKQKYDHLRSDANWYKEWRACNLWTAAFFYTYTEETEQASPSSERLQKYLQNPAAAYGPMIGKADALAMEHRFFHWPLEFPDVWEQGGFDVMLGNPPWEKIKLQQQEFFGTRDVEIATAPTAAVRNNLINSLPHRRPELYKEYEDAMHTADANSKFLRGSGRCKLTAVGDINTYSVFSELTTSLTNKRGATGIIVPTGVATDDSNKMFFGAMVEANRLMSLFDFENKEAIFPDVHRSYKFCLLTISGGDIGTRKSKFGFFFTRVEDLLDKRSIFSLSKDDFLRLNPNTKTCPVFRTGVDAELTAKIYRKFPILYEQGKEKKQWPLRFVTMYHKTNDSGLFKNRLQLKIVDGDPPIISFDNQTYVRLYEGVICWQYDHRVSQFIPKLNDYETSARKEAEYIAASESFVDLRNVQKRFDDVKWERNWSFGIRRVTNNTNERMIIGSFMPYAGVTYGMYLFVSDLKSIDYCLIGGQLNSIPFDYIARNSTSQPSLTYSVLYQLPVIPLNQYPTDIVYRIITTVFELTYTSWDIIAFADDVWNEAGTELKIAIEDQHAVNKEATGGYEWAPPEWCEIDGEGCPLPPFKWDEDRRAVLKAELDAIYAHLYGLTTEELRYILDPQDVYGPDFPGETFRVLKDKEMKLYKEYRTRRLVLEAWERMGYGELARERSASAERVL